MECLSGLWRRVVAKAKSWEKQELNASQVREPIFGNLLTITIAEVAAYRIIIQDVRVGALPSYMPYLLITLVAIVEAILAPIVSWLGYRTRRKMMLLWSVALIVTSFAWFLLPTPDSIEESEFCNRYVRNPVITYTGLSARTAIRLIVTIVTAICFCLSRAATWSHYVAYTDDYAPERTSVHYGIIVLSRVIPLIFGYKMLTLIVEQTVLLKTLIITISTIVNGIRIHFSVPRSVPVTEGIKVPSMDDRGFFQSLSRVLCNLVAMTQMVAMGLLAAAFWGFGYHEEEIAKTNYNVLPLASNLNNHTEFFRYFLAIVSVVYVGVKHSAPIRKEYEIQRGLKQVTKMTFIAAVMYVVIVMVPPCKKGQVAGLENNRHYVHPTCSLPCGCVPRWREYSPVCVVDTMTTYLSPCEAGCVGADTIDNLPVYSNCSCAVSGRAMPGACSDYTCLHGYNFHLAIFTIILTVSVLAFQSQGMVILKSVDPRDKSVAMGVMWSVIAIVAFVFGHNIFYFIALKSCSWLTGERCQLFNDHFPYLVGFTSAILTSISVSINFITKGYLRFKEKNSVAQSDEE
ncbi:solute carrier organic anion transporter family member 1B3-like [Zerene cesonia]|uniref:solute carrier organic anion transporter family member 1B3-like n=1 Tax=Zerene cesonia TaxID=33412 RepID=UPI0018E4E6C7|nr:solute carrier organic anion transporter family member 1B3-like [Zerene cesonia]